MQTVVYCYPRNVTGGCTAEAAEFRAALPEFRELGVTVYGVSTDGGAADRATFLLADGDVEVAYGGG